MNPFPKRLVVFQKDLQNITGLKKWSANKLAKKIRASKNKSPDDYLTVFDVCDYLKITLAEISKFLPD